MSKIIRIKKRENYVVLDKGFLNNTKLSWKAKGILAYMLSKPDDWTFYIDELMKHATDGERSFRAGFKELTEQGYVERKPVREGQRIRRWETIIHESPLHSDSVHVQNVDVQNVDVQKLHVQNEALLSNDLTNYDLTNYDSTNKESRKQVYDESSSYYQLSIYFYELILKNNPNHRKPNLQKWSDDIRKIVELDKRADQEVKRLIEWAQKDNFWKGNILSPASLRKQFDRLTIQSNQSSNKNGGSNYTPMDDKYDPSKNAF